LADAESHHHLALTDWRKGIAPVSKGKRVSQRVLLPPEYPTGEFDDDRTTMGKDMVGFHLSGKCPVCKHDSSAVCATRYLANEQHDDGESRDRYQVTALKCACVEDHTSEEQPAPLTFGCGAEWLLKVSWSHDNADVTVKKESVLDDEAWKAWAAADANGAAIPSTLTTYQGVAGKWQAALTAIVALVSVGTLLTGRSAFQSLATGWQVGLIAALAVAVLGNAAVLWKSDLASFGFPTLKYAVQSVKNLPNADLAPLTLAKKAEDQMWSSFGFAIPTILASMAAIAILLFVGPAPPTASYKVTEKLGTVSTTTPCGHFTNYVPYTSPVPAALQFTPNIAGAETVTLDGTNITTIESC